jgi:membrane-associated phospholipid phosphatase
VTRLVVAPPGRTHLAALALGVVLVAGSTGLAAGGEVPAWEERLFRPVNQVALPWTVVWTVMQLGNVAAVLVAAVAALVARRPRLAATLTVAGSSAYLLARVLKEEVDRGRPSELLADVVLRGATSAGRGFPSGHAAVAAALACVLWPRLGRRGRGAVLGAAVLVALARVHVGAHLPLDVVGGAAVGVACAAAVQLAGGRREPRRPELWSRSRTGGSDAGGP